MTVYLVIESGSYDEGDSVLAIYSTLAAAEAHRLSGGSLGKYSDGSPVWNLDITEMPLLDAYVAPTV